MNGTKIEWCNYFPGYKGETLNVITGCTPVSDGCKNCYAQKMAKRLAGRFGYPADEPFKPGVWHTQAYEKAYSWRKPRVVFVSSMGDLFHEEVKPSALSSLWQLMLARSQNLYLLLTKRPENVQGKIAEIEKECCNRCSWLLDLPEHIKGAESIWPANIWLGVTAENQECADRRIPELLQIPAAKHFVSCEPLLEGVDIEPYIARTGGRSVDWVIAGEETGPGARKTKGIWARALKDKTVEANTPFFWKKWSDGSREIDGREWNQTPEVSDE